MVAYACHVVEPPDSNSCDRLGSWAQACPSFFIEKRKRKMIAEDLAAALAL